MLDDETIVDMLFERSEAALEELSRKYTQLCTHVAGRVLENRSDVEECVNDVRLAVWNSIPPNRPKNLAAYLCTISRNFALNRLKYNTRQKRNSDHLVMLSELDESIPSPSEYLGAAFEEERVSEVISAFLRTLDRETRVLFVRRYVYFETPGELSERYGISVNSINVKLHRARKKLASKLSEEGIVW